MIFSDFLRSNSIIIPLLFLFPPALFQCLRDNPLQLAVDGAELVGSPAFHGFNRLGINAEQEGLVRIVFFFCHRLPPFRFHFCNHLQRFLLRGTIEVIQFAIHGAHFEQRAAIDAEEQHATLAAL